ncbi:MAG TPA: hypothetical protein VGL28_11430 [Steroidobacteraceae bacterium]|jgi:hypothetical protein
MKHSKDIIMRHIVFAAAAAGLALSGCAQTPLEADYGNSVRQMQEFQTYDRRTRYKPSAAPVEGADPDMLNLAIQSLRTEKVDRSQVSQPMTINIGGQSGQ